MASGVVFNNECRQFNFRLGDAEYASCHDSSLRRITGKYAFDLITPYTNQHTVIALAGSMSANIGNVVAFIANH